MVLVEAFVMREVARACPVIERHDQTRRARLSSDPTGRLDVFRACLGLTADDLRVPETKFDVSDGAWAGSTGGYLMRLLAV